MATNIYTPSGGYSAPAQSVQSLINTLGNISGPAASALQDYSTAALQQPAAVQQNYNQLVGQSGIPSLQASQQDLAKIFPLYLHDSNLSQQFASPALTNYQPGSATPTQATYNQPAADIISQFSGATGTPGGGFQGFTTPSTNTAAMGVVPSVSTNLMNLLGSAIGGQQDLVSKESNLYSQNYQAKMNLLSSLLGPLLSAEISSKTPSISDKLKAKSEGLTWNPKTQDWEQLNVGDISGTVDSSSASQTTADQRLHYQELFNSYPPGSTMQKKIEQAWNQSHKGMSLFPTSLNPKDKQDLEATRQVIRDFKWLEDEIKSGKLDNFLGSGGIYANWVNNPYLRFLLPNDVQRAEQILTNYRVTGERQGIGGRLTGYLLDRLAGAFPDLTQGKSAILDFIPRIYDNYKEKLNDLVVGNGWKDSQDFSQNSGYAIELPSSSTMNKSITIGRFTVTPE